MGRARYSDSRRLQSQGRLNRSPNVRFSNRPFRVKHFQTIRRCSVDVAHGLVLLFGIGTKASSIMGFEDEVEQSLGRRCRQTDGRSKQTYELTSSIVPRGTSFHRWVEFEFPPIAFDPARLSCCCGFFAVPPELSAVNPDAVHDHGQPARQRGEEITGRKSGLKNREMWKVYGAQSPI